MSFLLSFSVGSHYFSTEMMIVYVEQLSEAYYTVLNITSLFHCDYCTAGFLWVNNGQGARVR